MEKKILSKFRWVFLLLCLALVSLTSNIAYGKDFTVFVSSDFSETQSVTGWSWEPGSMVTLDIDYVANGYGTFEDPISKTVGADGVVDFPSEGSFTVGEGDLVRMSDDQSTPTVKEHYVEYVALTEVNPGTDTLTGSAREGSQVDVRVFDPSLPHPQGPDLSDVANASETWSVDFTPVFDIVSGHIGWIMVADEDGDKTQINWRAPEIPVTGYIHHVMEPGGSKTYIEVIIGEEFEGILPNDIASIEVTVTDSDGVTTPLALPTYEYFDQWRDFFFVIDGEPDLGVYTFTVASTPETGSLSGADTDHQYTKIDIPIPDTATFSPVNGATITSKTPSFSWDPVELPGVPLYYRLIIDDGGGNRVYSTGRVFGMTSHTVPEGELNPGQTYYWRVRVTDAADYEYLQNRASHVANSDPAAGKLSFTMANTLAHSNTPFIFPDDWLTTTYSTSEDATRRLCWLRINDHDGVASDGSSHHVQVTLPGGGTHTMDFDRADSAKVAAYYFWDENALAPGQHTYIYRVTDPDGNVGTLTESFDYNPLPLPDEDSIAPNVRAGQITASFDNIYVRKDGPLELYEDFNSYSSMDDIDWGDEWEWHDNAFIQRDNGNGWLVLDIGNSIGRAHGGLSFTDPNSINEIKADVTVTDINDTEGQPRARIRGTWCNNGIGDIGASLSVNGGRVYWSVGEEFINEQETWQWTDGQTGDLLTGLQVGDTVSLSISFVGNDLIFSATGPSGSNSYTYTVTNNLGPPIYQEKQLQTRIYSYTDTTPTFTWNPVAGANRHRVRIYNWDNSQTIWQTSTGETSLTIPPGILQPKSYYRFRLEAWDSHNPLNVDNVSKTPASNNDNYIFYTGSLEDDNPFIELASHGVQTWNSELTGTQLDFWIRVHDAQGVPGNIQSVKVIHPGGALEFLEYDGDNRYSPATPTSAIYSFTSSQPPADGVYRFIVEDNQGHIYEETEELTVNPIGYPPVTSLSPANNSPLIGSTAINFNWKEVEDAPGVPAPGFYSVHILDEDFNVLRQFHTTDNHFTLKEGFLKNGKIYRWRVLTRREFFDQYIDNMSGSPARFFDALKFITTSPDADEDGMPDVWEKLYGLNPALDDASGDLDQDGLSNLMEYLKGTYPDNQDTDGDNYQDGNDAFPLDSNEWIDSDGDGEGDNSDPCPNDPDNDSDGDGVCGDVDNCPAMANPDQSDLDGDEFGDVCDEYAMGEYEEDKPEPVANLEPPANPSGYEEGEPIILHSTVTFKPVDGNPTDYVRPDPYNVIPRIEDCEGNELVPDQILCGEPCSLPADLETVTQEESFSTEIELTQWFTNLQPGCYTVTVDYVNFCKDLDPVPDYDKIWLGQETFDSQSFTVGDQCSDLGGDAGGTGCPLAVQNTVILHTVNLGKGASTKEPVPAGSAAVRVFDRNSPAFRDVAGSKNPKGSLYGVIFEEDQGRVGTCVTDSNGVCFAGEAQTGDFLVIVRYIDLDPQGDQTISPKTVYVGSPMAPEDFDENGIGEKEFQIIKVFKKGVFYEYRGGSKIVVTGSIIEVVAPDSAIWEGKQSVYPFIFNSDSDWTVDVCVEVPTGYSILGVYDTKDNLLPAADCMQIAISKETRTVAFEVTAMGLPEPWLDATLTFRRPKGKKVTKKVKAMDLRKNTFRRKLAEEKDKVNKKNKKKK